MLLNENLLIFSQILNKFQKAYIGAFDILHYKDTQNTIFVEFYLRTFYL